MPAGPKTLGSFVHDNGKEALLARGICWSPGVEDTARENNSMKRIVLSRQIKIVRPLLSL